MRSRSFLHSFALVAPSSVLFALGLVACEGGVTAIPAPCVGPNCLEDEWIARLDELPLQKLDLLIALDNSRSMADKQALLAKAVPDLVSGLVSPPCVDSTGAVVEKHPLDPCPAGMWRLMPPVLDIHIGVLSSSLGGHGADTCPDVVLAEKACASNPNSTNNDQGHLVARLDPCSDAEAPSHDDRGFLAWDPTQSLSPPGDDNTETIRTRLQHIVTGVGSLGCEYESQLESVYRFLVDPEPYASISVVNFRATPEGTDTALLQQRADFLRPDSLLAIVMLSDENDCSIKEYGQFWYIGAEKDADGMDVRLPRARQECAIDPADPCCKSCGQDPGSCPEDPTCKNPDGTVARLAPEEDENELRCWDQKRRFGVDFLYPIDRYVQAFTSFEIQNRAGELVPNPIFTDLDPNDDVWQQRDPSGVFFTGIVGVPWQDIARDPKDISKGLKNAAEMEASIDGVTTWDVILGDPTKYVRPLDPLMIESVEKRAGTNPVTGDVLVDASAPAENPINGHERTIAGDDLQYACIFPVPAGSELDCTQEDLAACDCKDIGNDNPLCAENLQVRAKAYPGLRQLAVMKGLGDQAVVGSVCPARVDDLDAPEAGYRPVMSALRERLAATLEQVCLPRSMSPDAEGGLSCVMLESRPAPSVECPPCDPSEGRLDVPPEHEKLVLRIKSEAPNPNPGAVQCFCMVPQAEAGAARTACQEDVADPPLASGSPVNGWCYVDATTTPPLGNADLLAMCPDNQKRRLRFAGKAERSSDGTMYLSCPWNETP